MSLAFIVSLAGLLAAVGLLKGRWWGWYGGVGVAAAVILFGLVSAVLFPHLNDTGRFVLRGATGGPSALVLGIVAAILLAFREARDHCGLDVSGIQS